MRRSEPEFLNVKGAQESIPPAYVAWRAGMITLLVVPLARLYTGWKNRFLGIDSWALKIFTNSVSVKGYPPQVKQGFLKRGN
jgi:hypothetical protein